MSHVPPTCAVKAAAPLLMESEGRPLLKWAVLTACGRTAYVELPRGRRPRELPCCGRCPPLRPEAGGGLHKPDRVGSSPTAATERTVDGDPGEPAQAPVDKAEAPAA